MFKKSFTSGSYNLTKIYCLQLSDKIKTQNQVWSDKNGVVGSKLSFKEMSVIPKIPRASGGGGGGVGPLPGFYPGPAGDLKRSPDSSPTHAPLTTNPGSAPEYETIFGYLSDKKYPNDIKESEKRRIRILLSNRGPTRGNVITVIHKQ